MTIVLEQCPLQLRLNSAVLLLLVAESTAGGPGDVERFQWILAPDGCKLIGWSLDASGLMVEC